MRAKLILFGGSAMAGLCSLYLAAASAPRVLRLSGQTSARGFANVVAPRPTGPESGRAMILLKLAQPGALVKRGDLVAEIDAQSAKDHLDDLTDTIRQAKADIVKRKAEQTVEWETLQQTLRSAKAGLDKAKLDAATVPLLTDIERELLQLSVEEARARYAGLRKELALRKQANDAEIRILEITAERHQGHYDRHAHDLERFTIYAPIGGLVVMQSIWRGGDMSQVRQGDQLHPRQLFMKIVDPKSMQVEAWVNQAESSEIHVGQKAKVHLDAFPDLEFSGEIVSVGALATRPGWMDNAYIRRIPVRVAIGGTDPRIIPDLSASADIQLDGS